MMAVFTRLHQTAQFSTYSVKATLNLGSKLAQNELVLIVDENDQPVKGATRLEMVRIDILA